jgi:CubicO group peptidase (beta-lactamase class C family)
MLRLLVAVVLPLLALGQHRYNKWRPLEEQLEGWSFTENFAVNVGNATHTLFTYESVPGFMHKVVQTQSTSKWPMAMMLTGLVADGTIRSLDSRPNEYLPWWTKDPEDPRSNVTLRNLLSFTSGFGSGAAGSEGGDPTCMDAPLGWTFENCARNIYETTNYTKRGGPGEVFAYNSIHLQLAGAMAVAAAKLPIELLIEKYFIKAYGMNETRCAVPSRTNPQLAICLETTGYDYSKFLRSQLRREVPSRQMVFESERDYTPFMNYEYQLYGVYGFWTLAGVLRQLQRLHAEVPRRQRARRPRWLGVVPTDRPLERLLHADCGG